MYTYQDFIKDYAADAGDAISRVIREHTSSSVYRTAVVADKYDRQQNETIMRFVRWLYNGNGMKAVDTSASNHRMCSNFFNRLNTQRMTYSLGNGITFPDKGIKDKLGGADFDTQLHTAGYYGLIHGVAYIFKNDDHCHVFKVTEFAPLYDELTGQLRAGVRFWQLDAHKPMTAILYEEDGYTQYTSDTGHAMFEETEAKRAYMVTIKKAPADKDPEEIISENYSSLPIVPLYGSRLHQSTLIGMQSKIDGYDLIQSGFANDLTDCSEIYWLVSGAGGMNDKDLARFRDRLKLNHIADVPNSDDVSITPYTQEIPYQARKELLDNLRQSIYEDFGALDVHTVSAGATNDHIDAAYQPMDENADDYEYQIIIAVQALLALDGITDAVPTFKRNRISNQKETAEIVLMFAQYLSDDIVRAHIPFLTFDEVNAENKLAAANAEFRITDETEAEAE